tara:strand:+ start:997 stop:1272 length:276 start_codon:yes stop_codon:yes gene_type:complete
MNEVNYLAGRDTRVFDKTKDPSGAILHTARKTYTLISREVFRTYKDCKSYCNKQSDPSDTFAMECNFPMPDTLIMTDEVYEAQIKKNNSKH